MKAVSKAGKVSLVVVGSVALDTVKTPSAQRRDILGGSVSYACTAASFFGRVGMVGVVGRDFAEAHVRRYRKSGIDVSGLLREDGRTFKWSGVYEENMNNRRTLLTELNVFAEFRPSLPGPYRESPFLFLANISPDLQYHVLGEMKKPHFVVADTMDLWIKTAHKSLMKVISSVDMIMLNDSEASLLTGEGNLADAARKVLRMGPRYVIVKKGEHGATLFSGSSIFMLPAYPVSNVVDPTGAGDTFAGGFMGALMRSGRLDARAVREAMVYGTVLASFAVEAFSIDGLTRLTRRDIESRAAEFIRMISII